MSRKTAPRLILLVYVLCIYAMLPITRPVVTFLREHNLLRATLAMICLAGAICIARILKIRLHMPWPHIAGWISAMTAVFLLASALIPLPEERLHLIEYGVLAPLTLSALKSRWSNWKLYFVAFLFCSLIGLGDESIQYFLPDRYFEWRDVGLNVLGSLMGLGFCFKILPFKSPVKMA